MYNTIARPSCDLRNNYSDVIRSVKEHNQVLITNNGKGEAVLINADDYADYEEYLHVRYVKEKLEEAEARSEDPTVQWLTREEFFVKARAKLDV